MGPASSVLKNTEGNCSIAMQRTCERVLHKLLKPCLLLFQREQVTDKCLVGEQAVAAKIFAEMELSRALAGCTSMPARTAVARSRDCE